MEHRVRTTGIAAAALMGLSASMASATINITNAHLVNTYIYDFGTPTAPFLPTQVATVVLDSSSPGSSFSSVDANGVGFVSSIDPATGGMFRVSTNGTTLYGGNGLDDEYRGVASGSVNFVADAPFSLGAGTPADLASFTFASGSLKLTNLSTGQSLLLTPPDNGVPALTGDLSAIVAPAGNYQVDFTLTDERATGVTQPGALQLDLVTTPEPATLATLVVPSLLLRRRRRAARSR